MLPRQPLELAAENFARAQRALDGGFVVVVRARSMTVRSFGVTGMPLTIARSIDSDWCALMRGCECRDGAVTSNGRPSHSSRPCRTAAASSARGPRSRPARLDGGQEVPFER